MKLGTCYYPEHWPEAMWAEDAQKMVDLGLTYVRIGEFAWAQMEPEPGQYDWGWLDRAVDTLSRAGLKIIMGTPTATPPKWLVDAHPDILPCDAHGWPRRFGSRRHYCFSSQTYVRETARIVTAMAERYGGHPAIVMWQTDNEFGCHETVESFSPDAANAFRQWLSVRYENIEALNAAWGTSFWSQVYRSFDEVDPPMATVTEAHPAHCLDWRRFSSDQVARYNQMQMEIIQQYAPGADLTHNFMGQFTDFNHYDCAKGLDIASWDSYPLGFLEQSWWPAETKLAFERTGHPDFAGFHHDLYRSLCGGRFAVMEQQPGPVNWAAFNPAPKSGMVEVWTLEAAAHGAEFVSYFRWRSAPFAQEQYHAGLNRQTGAPDVASTEARQALAVLKGLAEDGDLPQAGRGDVALIFDYEAQWLFEIQPQGRSFRYLELAFSFYTALRRAGLNVDICAPDQDLSGYGFIVAPSLPWLGTTRARALLGSGAQVLVGPRTGSKHGHVALPTDPATGLGEIFPGELVRAESLRPGSERHGTLPDGQPVRATRWIDHIETTLSPQVALEDGTGVLYRHESLQVLTSWPDETLLSEAIQAGARGAGLTVRALPEGLRLRRRGALCFAFNYGNEAIDLAALGLLEGGSPLVYGASKLPPARTAIWRI